jgi:hypothetical protein
MQQNVPHTEPRQEPLAGFFEELIARSFKQRLGLVDSEITMYVSDLLTQFNRTENLYRIRNSQGKPLEEVGEMLLASNPLWEAASFDREREVRKHIGDFTLFFAGLFPEALNRWRLRRMRFDSMLDYVRAGKESYYIVSEFNQFEYRSMSPFFKKMSDHFETCVFGLNLVKQELVEMRKESYLRGGELVI